MKTPAPTCHGCAMVRELYEKTEHAYDNLFTLHPWALLAWYARLRGNHFHIVRLSPRDRRLRAIRDTIPQR